MIFKKDEIYTATEVVRNFSSCLDKLQNQDNKKIVILKNNKFQAVILSIKEFEKLQEAVELLEKIYKTKN